MRRRSLKAAIAPPRALITTAFSTMSPLLIMIFNYLARGSL